VTFHVCRTCLFTGGWEARDMHSSTVAVVSGRVYLIDPPERESTLHSALMPAV
jgi:hypothetical protein